MDFMKFTVPPRRPKPYVVWAVYETTQLKNIRAHYVVINNENKKVHSTHKSRDTANKLCQDLNRWSWSYGINS